MSLVSLFFFHTHTHTHELLSSRDYIGICYVSNFSVEIFIRLGNGISNFDLANCSSTLSVIKTTHGCYEQWSTWHYDTCKTYLREPRAFYCVIRVSAGQQIMNNTTFVLSRDKRRASVCFVNVRQRQQHEGYMANKSGDQLTRLLLELESARAAIFHSQVGQGDSFLLRWFDLLFFFKSLSLSPYLRHPIFVHFAYNNITV